MPRLSDREVIELYKTMTLKEISAIDGRHITTLWHILNKCGVPRRRRGVRKNHVLDRHVVWMCRKNAGDSYQRIADEYGVTRQAVHLAITRLRKEEEAKKREKKLT